MYATLGDAYLSEGYYGAALEAYLQARRLPGNYSKRSRDDKIMAITSGYIDFEKLNSLIATELDGNSRSILALAIADKLIDEGKEDEAALVLFKLDKLLLPVEFYPQYEELKRKTYKKSGKSKTIGIIQSVGGSYEKLGRAFIGGVHEAMREIQRRYGYSVFAEVIETEDGLSGIRASEILSRNSDVLAIIGPINNSVALAVGAAGKDGAIPLLFPTSALNGFAQVGESIYQMNSNLYQQGRYAARYAINQLAASTIAVLAPLDELGRTNSRLFDRSR